MKKITLKIKWKLISDKETKNLELPKGITGGELLDLLGVKEKNQILVIYDGRPVFLDELLDRDGEIIIMPILSGG